MASRQWLSAARCLQIDQWTAEVVTEFRRRSIRPILLKGPAVARWLYAEDPSIRPYLDVDLMVAPVELQRAEDGLRALGYLPWVALRPHHGLRPHADTWERSRDSAFVDLHITLHDMEDVNPALVWEAVTEATERLDVAGVEVEIPGIVARTLNVVVNLGLNEPPTSQSSEDLLRAIERVDFSVWSAAAGLATRLGVAPAMGTKLRTVAGGTDLAERLDLPAEVPLQLALLRQGASSPVRILFRLESLTGWRAKATFALGLVAPPPSLLRYRWPLARRGWLGLAASYPAWIALALARLPKAVVRWRALRSPLRTSLQGDSPEPGNVDPRGASSTETNQALSAANDHWHDHR